MAKATDLKARTKAFAVRVVRLVDSLPRRRSCDVIAHQLMKSATSVGKMLAELMREANEITAMTVASIKTAKAAGGSGRG